jgi:hypothetical protein
VVRAGLETAAVAISSSLAKTTPANLPAGATLYCGGHEPVFLAAIAFATGIVAANYLWRSPVLWLGAFLLTAAAAALLPARSAQTGFIALLLSLVALGGFFLQARDAAAPTVETYLQPFANGEDRVDVTAHVFREGLIRDSPYGGKQESVDVETEKLRLGDREVVAPVGVRLTLYSKQAEEYEARESGAGSPLPVYPYGQRLHFSGKLRLPRNYRDPGAMDLTGYLASQGIRLTGSAQASMVEILPGFAGSRVELWRSAARRSVLEHIMRLWPGERGALMQAAIIGGRAFFRAGDQKRFPENRHLSHPGGFGD